MVMLYIHKSIKLTSFIFFFFSFSVLFGQETLEKKIAETIFGKYHKLELEVGGSVLFITNEANGVEYEYHNIKAFNLGLTYNFIQSGNFNFKGSVLWRIYKIRNTELFRKKDTSLPYSIYGKVKVGDFTQFLFPFQVEYFFSLTQKLSFFIGLGPELIIYPEDPSSGYTYVIVEDKEIGYKEVGNSKDGWLYVGLNASVGLNIEAGPLLLRPTFTYHYQPETLFTNVVTTQNLMVSKNTVSTHEITGNYIMFGLSVTLKRGLFKKNEHER